jgi:hypothetical protein
MPPSQLDFSTLKNRPWQSVKSQSQEMIFSMLTAEERSMLEWLGQHFAKTDASLCDLGAFAGGSTAALASGLRRANLGARAKVHSFDFFEIPEARKQRMLYRRGFPKFAGTDFLPIVQTLLHDIDDLIIYHKGNFLLQTWNNGPIQLIHVDISKSYALNRHILNEFFVFLQPGSSILVQQDYQHWSNPWVAASMELLEEYFELLSWTEENAVVFGCTKALPKGIGDIVEKELRRPSAMKELLVRAKQRFPAKKQRESLDQSLLAFEANPGVQKAWQFRLPSKI